MPPGTIGFRSEGDLTDEDFRDDLAPALREALTAGPVRLMLITPPGSGTGDVKRIMDQVKEHLDLGHRTDWKRIAVLTGSGALRRSSRLWTRVIPIETRLFKPDEEAKAKHWLLES